jgi:transcription factor C subunit 6
MVRTRRTNKTKRYTEYALGPDDDDQDGTAQSGEAAADDLSDFAAEHGENEVSAQEDDESDADEDDAADHSDRASNAGRAPRRRKNPRKTQLTARPSTNAKHGVDYHELPVYPLDPRISTRAYTGPLKRGARSGILRDIMYGPEYSKAKLIWDLYERWARYAVLPSRHPPQHPGGVLPSPWVPPGFELNQEKLAAKWYDVYTALSTEKSRSHPVLQKHGERLIPQGQGDLTVLLGPVQSQKESRFTTSAGIALSTASLPLDEPDNPDNTPNGWIFDVGGIPLALGWAPILTGGKQILALAVIPHSDQTRPTGDAEAAAEDEKRHGSIQFWEFAWNRDEEDRLRPCRSPPKFLLAKCFDWGRPKRMQWCPVSFGMAGLYGLLAVLCGDGRVRVLDVKTVEESEKAAYGKAPLLCPNDLVYITDSLQNGSTRRSLHSASQTTTMSRPPASPG